MIHILLVDDHASTREPLAYMLNQEPDLTVIAQAGSLTEARSAIDDFGPSIDLAILDLGLPDGSGEELIPNLKAANADVALLVLTYFSEQDRLARAVTAGASGILHKSASVQDVIDATRRLDAGEQLVTVNEIVDALQRIERERQQDRDAHLRFEKLTTREHEVLQALADGLSDREMAERFYISPATVRTHVTNLLTKLGAASRLQALVMAVRNGIVTID